MFLINTVKSLKKEPSFFNPQKFKIKSLSVSITNIKNLNKKDSKCKYFKNIFQ